VALADCCRMCIYLHYGELPCHILLAGRYRGGIKNATNRKAGVRRGTHWQQLTR
jgi:hypothetical protein